MTELLETIGKFLAKLWTWLTCGAPHRLPGVITSATDEKHVGSFTLDWFTVKDLSVPVDYIDFLTPKGPVRWYRGDVQVVSFKAGSVEVAPTAVATTFTFVFGTGRPPQTCCFEAREADEDVTWYALEAVLTGDGTVDTVFAKNRKRVAVIIYNSDGTNSCAFQGSSPAGNTGAYIAAEGSLTLAGKSASGLIGIEANAGTPTLKCSYAERT